MTPEQMVPMVDRVRSGLPLKLTVSGDGCVLGMTAKLVANPQTLSTCRLRVLPRRQVSHQNGRILRRVKVDQGTDDGGLQFAFRSWLCSWWQPS